MKLRDLLGMFLLMIGVSGFMSGIRGVSANAWWGGPAIGAGLIVNVVAYRTMKPGRDVVTRDRRTDDKDESDPPATHG